ncbi:MAG: hypothetical protein H7256_14620 [Bdellovibrio sp.]|nr:hypothetical protein [Bdellovibrio sp.]
MNKLVLMTALTMISQVSFAAECKNGKSVRKVDIVYEAEGKKAPCSVKYTKEDGTEKTLFTAKAEEGYCEKKSTEFMDKMKTNGWVCESDAK